MGLRKPNKGEDFGFKPEEESFGFEEDNPSKQRASKLDLLKQFNEAGHKTAMPGFAQDALHAGTGLLDEVTLKNLQYSPEFQDAISAAKTESPTSFNVGKGAGMLGLGAGMAALPGGLPAMVLAGGAQGALERPGNNLSLEEDALRRAENAGRGAATSLGLGVVGKGLSKVGDYAMQKAVGAKELIPGMGNRIADEGLIGTRGMMRGQIQRAPGVEPGIMGRITDFMGLTNKLPAREASLNKVIPQMTGNVSNIPSVDAISREGAMLVPKNINIPIFLSIDCI